MVVIGPCLRDHSDVGSGAATESCVIKSGLDLELFNRIGVGNRDATAARAGTQYITHAKTIDLPVVIVRSRSMRKDSVIRTSDL